MKATCPGSTLAEGEIHVWLARLDRPAPECYMLMQTLDRDERTRAERFHFRKHRNRFIAGRGILRKILGRYLGVKASEIRFYYGKNGKPGIADMPGKETLHFNLSHSGGIGLFAFARNHEVGVDIERIRDISEMGQIVERFFSPGEKIFFRTAPQNEKKKAFFDCWTRKEAFIKAIGAGLTAPLHDFQVPLLTNETDMQTATEEDPLRAACWSIHHLKPARGYSGVLAVNSKGLTIRCFRWMPDIVSADYADFTD